LTTGGDTNPGQGFPGPAPRIPDDHVEAFFDRELDPALTRDLLADLKHDPARSEEIARTQRMLSLLRRTPGLGEQAEEDLLDAVLDRIERRRRFLPESWRRLVTAGRLATAATVLLAGLAVAVVGRTHPDLLRLTTQPAPMASLIDNARTEVNTSAAIFTYTFETLSGRAMPLMQEVRAVVDDDRREPFGALAAGLPDLSTDRHFNQDLSRLIVRGGADLSAEGLSSSFLGIELSCSRQRSGVSAPVCTNTAPCGQSVALHAARPGAASAAVLTRIGGPVACQSVTVGDHTVVVPATLDQQDWVGGRQAVSRLLLIQSSPSDLFPPR
jgi:hypothetical protein